MAHVGISRPCQKPDVEPLTWPNGAASISSVNLIAHPRIDLMRRRKFIICALFAALSAGLAAGNAPAQGGYPEKTIRILVGFPSGGPPDVASRLLADKFSESWGTPVVVENVPGAG